MPLYVEGAYVKKSRTPHWHDVEITKLGEMAENAWQAAAYIDEQILWWKMQGIPSYEAYEAVYGKALVIVRWDQLRERMIRDFT